MLHGSQCNVNFDHTEPMVKKLVLLILTFLELLPGSLFSQTKPTFSGDPDKFRTELTAFMGPNLNDQQKVNLNTFLFQ
jgi:hypothetical protein